MIASTFPTPMTAPTVPARALRVHDADPAVLRQARLLWLQPALGIERFSLPAFELILLLRRAQQRGDLISVTSDELLEAAGDRALREVVTYELRIALADLAQLQPLVDLQRVALLALQRAIMERRLIGGQYWVAARLEGNVFGLMAEATSRAREQIMFALDHDRLRARFGDRALLGDPEQLANRLATHTRSAAGGYADNYGVCLMEALLYPLASLTSPRYEGRYDALGAFPRNWTDDCRRSDILHDVVKTLLAELDEQRELAGMSTVVCTDSGIPTLLNA